MESDKNNWLRKLDGQRSLCPVICSCEVVVWDGITWHTWGREVLRSEAFYMKCTQSRSTRTFKPNFPNSVIIHVLIFISIFPREPKETFGSLMIATGHCLLHVAESLSKWALSWLWGLADGPDAHPFPYFSFKHPAPSWEHAGHVSPAFFFPQTCVTKFLRQDTGAPEDSSGHLHIFKLVDLFKLNMRWWPAVGCEEGEDQQGQEGSRQETTSWKYTKKSCPWCALWYS